VREWLIERFTLLDVSFQNWMVVALAMIVIAVLVWKAERKIRPSQWALSVSTPRALAVIHGKSSLEFAASVKKGEVREALAL
jgi:hypothetical protein